MTRIKNIKARFSIVFTPAWAGQVMIFVIDMITMISCHHDFFEVIIIVITRIKQIIVQD